MTSASPALQINRRRRALALLLSLVALAGIAVSHAAEQPVATVSLQSPQAFDAIADRSARSRALFLEAGKVIQSPRCVNCHPAGDRPLQGDAGQLHEPAVVRGSDGHGATGLRCDTCHQAENVAASGVPGSPKWHLAPLSMAWQGKSLADICRQIRDPKRNGGMTLARLQHHMAEDDLVGWAWNPGGNRTPAPGTQAEFGELIAAWIQTGAKCPID